VKEKLLAAQRAGINRVLIPRENVPDLKELPEETRKKLEIIPVDSIEDVLREALGINLPDPGTLLRAGAAQIPQIGLH
jgi:ATP-dependent Lon protease